MNLNTSILVIIKDGVGELEFPHALKRDLFMSTICCQSLFLEANESSTNKGFLIVCDASFYISQNGEIIRIFWVCFNINQSQDNLFSWS